MVSVGQAIPASALVPSIRSTLRSCGAAGTNVNASPAWSIAVHCVTAGQETPDSGADPSVAVLAPFGAAGLKVHSSPNASTAVHCVTAGQAIATSPCPSMLPWPITSDGIVGSNVVSLPKPSTLVHWVAVGQAIPCWKSSTSKRYGRPGAPGSNGRTAPL